MGSYHIGLRGMTPIVEDDMETKLETSIETGVQRFLSRRVKGSFEKLLSPTDVDKLGSANTHANTQKELHNNSIMVV